MVQHPANLPPTLCICTPNGNTELLRSTNCVTMVWGALDWGRPDSGAWGCRAPTTFELPLTLRYMPV